jgi:hypothetical protein
MIGEEGDSFDHEMVDSVSGVGGGSVNTGMRGVKDVPNDVKISRPSIISNSEIEVITGELLSFSPELGGLEAERLSLVEGLLRREFNYDEFGLKMEESANDIKLRHALETISSDLYSEDVHFVMELVQNADDNQYDDGVCPSLLIELKESEIVVHNNERGFEEANIFAVCSVGDSTKKVYIYTYMHIYTHEYIYMDIYVFILTP